jgi:hypothetical protein
MLITRLEKYPSSPLFECLDFCRDIFQLALAGELFQFKDRFKLSCVVRTERQPMVSTTNDAKTVEPDFFWRFEWLCGGTVEQTRCSLVARLGASRAVLFAKAYE